MRTQNAFERERAEGGALPADIKKGIKPVSADLLKASE